MSSSITYECEISQIARLDLLRSFQEYLRRDCLGGNHRLYTEVNTRDFGHLVKSRESINPFVRRIDGVALKRGW